MSGLATVMVDVDEMRIETGLANFRKSVCEADAADALTRLSTATELSALGQAEVLIEAVTESEALKTEVHARLAKVLLPDAIQATNTSTISILRLAKEAAR